jgi:methionyl-tRNA formyltransferase
MEQTPVHRYARERGLSVLTPEAARSEETLEGLRRLEPDLLVLASYGKMLPGAFLEAAPLGALNVHPSLLPLYRGAVPVQAAILAGDAETGTSLIVMDEGLDTGPVVAQETIALDGTERAPELMERLFRLGAAMVRDHGPAYASAELRPTPQVGGDPPMRRLAREAGELDWAKGAVALERQVRAYDPWPGAYTAWGGAKLDITDASVLGDTGAVPGTVVAVDTGVGIATADGVLGIRRLRLAGRGEVAAADFVRGHAAFVGAHLPS